MKNTRPHPDMIDDENPEWTDEMFASAVRMGDLPPSLQTKLSNKGGRPVSDNPKIAVKLRLDPDVVEKLRASGKGWQTRVNAVIREYVAHL